MRKKVIAVDFDGVLHSFMSGWKGTNIISDPPVKNAIAWLASLAYSNTYNVVIFSARNESWRGRRAIKKWLFKWGLSKSALSKVSFMRKKPPAHLLLDDRVMLFTGTFPTLSEIDNFQPWHGQNIWGDDE